MGHYSQPVFAKATMLRHTMRVGFIKEVAGQ